jgi:hypothetical protein
MRIIKKALWLGLMGMLCFGCIKPTQDIKIVVNTNVIKYSALIHVTDADNPGFAPPDLTLTLSGQNAADIYEIAGNKNFAIVDGIIAIGPGPALVPTAANPVRVNLNLVAPGYDVLVKSIQFVPGQLQQVIEIVMTRVDSSPVMATPMAVVNATKVAVTLNFVALCANKSNFELLPSIYLFYRETGSNAGYAYLGYMDKGQITANLVMGKTYDFKFTYAGVSYVVKQRIDETAYTETITLGDVCSTF